MTYSPLSCDRDYPTIWIMTNSPGELSTWVAPVVYDLKSVFPEWRVAIMLVPCQYASGMELEIATNIPGVDWVTSPSQTLSELKTRPIRQSKWGAVLMLGGDPIYAKLLGWKWQVPVVVYTEHSYPLGWGIHTVLRKSEIGDLMAARFVDLTPVSECYDVVFYTGSRPTHFELFAPFCLEIARRLPGYRILIQKSPFITDDAWRRLRESGTDLSVTWSDGPGWDMLRRARLAVMLPGSSTAEAAYLGTPMLVVVPLNRPDLIQLDGLIGLVGKIPGIGTLIKRCVLGILQRKRPLTALPNRMVGRQLVPELQGVVTESEVADAVLGLLTNPQALQKQRTELKQFVPSTQPLVSIRTALNLIVSRT